MLRTILKTKKSTTVVSLLVILSGVVIVPQVRAEEIVISGNGAESNNEVNVHSSSDTTVNQTNNAEVSNDVDTTVNTGGNSASDNTGGDVSVVTGDASSSTNITNSANSSTVDMSCCVTNGVNVSISGNGAFSDNSVDYRNNSSTDVRVDQDAYINNDIEQYLNTGWNRARNNVGGDVVIGTGNIHSLLTLENGPINIADVSVPFSSFDGNVYIDIFGNGAFSQNEANIRFNNSTEILVNNAANIINNLKNKFDTGHNKADKNVGGDVAILTGDIVSDVFIKNGPINVSSVTVECCVKEEEEKPVPSKEEEQPSAPAPAAAAPAAPSAVSPIAQAAEAAGQVLGAAAQNLLPVTGNNWFFFAMIANVLMLLLGAYLRLRSGRSPTAI